VTSKRRILRVGFETLDAFQSEYDGNLCNGGVFVATSERFELREAVDVELFFEYSGQSLTLAGEVVHHITPEMSAMGGASGVAVQFQLGVQKLRDRLESMAFGQRGARAAAEARDGGGGERAARRAAVRVAARIQGGQELITGQTRNLSLTGVLVNVQGRSVAIGEIVGVRLTHPDSGEERTIQGSVVRQVQAEGEVTALAVQFTPEELSSDETVRFIEEIQATEHTRRLGAISGPIHEIGPQSLLQMFANSSPRGTLLLRCGEEEGVVCFEGGLLRLAQVGAATGMDALVRMLAWRDGVFEFSAHMEDREMRAAPFPLEAALFDAVRRIDEGRRPSGGMPLHARLVRLKGADVDAYGELSKVEAAVLDLASAGFTVQRALEVIPEPDPEIFRALHALRDAALIDLKT
jgi:Tfp pilus assembly protein PilZ